MFGGDGPSLLAQPNSSSGDRAPGLAVAEPSGQWSRACATSAWQQQHSNRRTATPMTSFDRIMSRRQRVPNPSQLPSCWPDRYHSKPHLIRHFRKACKPMRRLARYTQLTDVNLERTADAVSHIVARGNRRPKARPPARRVRPEPDNARVGDVDAGHRADLDQFVRAGIRSPAVRGVPGDGLSLPRVRHHDV